MKIEPRQTIKNGSNSHPVVKELATIERVLALSVGASGLLIALYWITIAIIDGGEASTLTTAPILGRCRPPTVWGRNVCELRQFTSPGQLWFLAIISLGFALLTFFFTRLSNRTGLVVIAMSTAIVLGTSVYSGVLVAWSATVFVVLWFRHSRLSKKIT